MDTSEGDEADTAEGRGSARRLGWLLFLVVLVLFLAPLLWKLSLE